MVQLKERTYEEWKDIANHIFNDSKKLGFNLRLTGGIAVRMHCPGSKELFEKFKRKYADVDFICLSKDSKKIKDYFKSLNSKLDNEVYTFSEGKRMIFENINGMKIEIFVDELDFCHLIDLRKRFKIDYPTIPLADLLLSKLQIVKTTEKDQVDIAALLSEHETSFGDEHDKINVHYISRLLADDWGFYFTVKSNLEKMQFFFDKKSFEKNRYIVLNKISVLLQLIDSEEKTLRWKAREIIGTKIQWYKTVA
jgi:hypothetical protein